MDAYEAIGKLWDVAEDWEADVVTDLAVRAGIFVKCEKCGWTRAASDAECTSVCLAGNPTKCDEPCGDADCVCARRS